MNRVSQLTKKLSLLLLLATVVGVADVQQAITPIGGCYINQSGESLSYSCGEVAVRRSVARAITVVNITEYFTEGVQQAWMGDVKNAVVAPLPFSVNVYPNPAQDWVEVNAVEATTELDYVLFDLQGKTVREGATSQGAAQLDITTLPAGTYMLRLSTADKKRNNVYKIIKAK